MDGVRAVCLQRDHRPRAYHDERKPVNLSEGYEKLPIVCMDDRESWPDLAELTAWIKGLDLVITVDTAVAHLAGSLGVETWILLPYNPDWRWKTEGATTDWYSSVRLFRQPKPGDWDSVFREVADELTRKNKYKP